MSADQQDLMENEEYGYVGPSPDETVAGISLPPSLARQLKQKMLLYSVSLSIGSAKTKCFHAIKNNFEFYLLTKDSHLEHFDPVTMWKLQNFLTVHGLMDIPEFVRYIINSNTVQIDLTGETFQRNTDPWHMQEIYIRIAQKCNTNLLYLKMQRKIACNAKSYLFRNLTNLRILELNDTHVTDSDLATVGTVCTKLRKLTVTNEPHVTDVGLRHIYDPRLGGYCSKLSHIRLNGLNNVSVERSLLVALTALPELTCLELDDNSNTCSMDAVMYCILLYGFKPLKLEHITLTDQHLADPRINDIFTKVLVQVKCVKLIVLTPSSFSFPRVATLKTLTIMPMIVNDHLSNVIATHSDILESIKVQSMHASITFDILMFGTLQYLQRFELRTQTKVQNMSLLDPRLHFCKLRGLTLDIPNQDTKCMLRCIFLNPFLRHLKLINFNFDLVELSKLLAHDICRVSELTLSRCTLFNLLLARIVITLPNLKKFVVDVNHPFKDTLHKIAQVLGVQFDVI